MENKKYYEGIWTPCAEVLCPQCCGYHDSMNILEEDNVLTTCNNCGKEIQIYDEVGLENNITKKLREIGIDANMYQTGGMCSACSVGLENGEEFLIKGCLIEGYSCEKYDCDGCYDGEEYSFYCKSEQEMIDYIKSIKNTCKICIK